MTLETALPAPHVELAHGVVARPEMLGSLMRPLGARMGLLVIRSAHDWATLVSAAPALRNHAPPEFGCVVCLVTWTGTPLSGKFPLAVRSVFVADGAAAVVADFEPGTYLPDAATYITAILAPGVREVLEVDVSGTRFSLAGQK